MPAALALLFLTPAVDPADAPFPPIRNTQPGDERPTTPAEAAAAFTVPEGFEVTLFAGEPDASQPIALDFDDRGRLWIAECFTYAGRDFDFGHGDRVTIFHDRDGDGRHDERTVFWDGGRMLTGLTWGFGGLWVLNDGTLSFIPDRDRDDVPDGPPEVLLDGWTFEAGHNVVNGLLWGPDGWLYGRHGITATSHVGVPGTPAGERTPINCGIWRFHPTRHTFEVVAHGTTNPWGLDYDEHGEFFFTNNVIGHAWHLIPGAHYRRMFGDDFNPHLYELIDQHADHYHWDTDGGDWTASRAGKDGAGDIADDHGGGHSHAGGMIYLGDNWPAEYRGDLFMCNTHGRRVNRDAIETHDSGYKITHKPDFAFANQPWFKGVDLKYGPDGGVFLLDWTDLGECHDHDGVHRTSGRIYKITYGRPERAGEAVDLAEWQNWKLIQTALADPNAWHRRHAARLLIEPEVWNKKLWKGRELFPTAMWLMSLVAEKKGLLDRVPPGPVPDTPLTRLRAARLILASYGVNAVPPPEERMDALGPETWVLGAVAACFTADDPRVRAAGPGLATEAALAFPKLEAASLVGKAADAASLPDRERLGDEAGPPILLASAAQLQRLPQEQRFAPAVALASRGDLADDHNLPLVIWYGVEPAVAAYPEEAVDFAAGAEIPKLRRFTVRRLSAGLRSTGFQPVRPEVGLPARPVPAGSRYSDDEAAGSRHSAEAVGKLLTIAIDRDDAFRTDVLGGLVDGLAGRRKVEPPPGWDAAAQEFAASESETVRTLTRDIGVVFGSGRALDAVRAVVADANLDPPTRAAAIATLAEARDVDSLPVLLDVVRRRRLEDRGIVAAAARGLAAFDDDAVPDALLGGYPNFNPDARRAAVETLAGRARSARLLADAVANGSVDPADLTAADVRQLRAFGDDQIDAVLDEHWGTARATSAETAAEVARWKGLLAENETADPRAGRMVFAKVCGNCHTLYGEGGEIGPNLTGSDRRNLDYLLGNILDPSATVPKDWRVSTVLLTDGRVLTGVVSDAGGTRSVQTAERKITLPAGDVEEVSPSDLSLMPSGLLDTLSEEQVRDLVAYLRTRGQVALP